MHDKKLQESENGHSEKKISVNELYEFIIKRMSPEEALKKLLSSSLIKYEKLKIKNPEDMVHPEIIIAMAALDLGWDIAVESEDKNSTLDGLIVGTSTYINKILKNNNESNIP